MLNEKLFFIQFSLNGFVGYNDTDPNTPNEL